MSWFKDMLLGKSKEPQTLQELLSRVTRRAEDLSAREQIASYVEAKGLSGTLLNKDNKVIFGRRGTGKTHALTYVQDAIQRQGDVAIYIDMRKLGSNNSLYNDLTKPAEERATYALRDFVTALSDGLTDGLTSYQIKLRNGHRLHDLLEDVAECSRQVLVSQTIVKKEGSSNNSNIEGLAKAGAKLSLTESTFDLAAEGKAGTSSAQDQSIEKTGTLRYSLNFGSLSKALDNLQSLGDFCIWILLDEWSSLPIQLQPFFADFLKRSLFVCRSVTVQVAAIEYRSKFRIRDDLNDIGFELGSDIFAGTNLDDFFVYDFDKAGVTTSFSDLFFRHLAAVAEEGELPYRSASEMISNSFTQKEVFAELVRACEGVPRDFINIAKLAFSRTNSGKVSMPEIRNAAKAWYERDKKASVDTRPDARALLDQIHADIVVQRKLRSFLVDWSVRSDVLDYLFDERIIHIARRSYSSKNNPGKRYRVWNLDFGCYVDLKSTDRKPDDLDLEELEALPAEDSAMPADDYRAVR